MQEDNYIGPKFQLSPPVQPDYKLLIESMGEVGQALNAIWDGIVRVVGNVANALVDAFSTIGWTVEAKPTRSKLRLKRHRIQYEKRVAWKAEHMQRIYAREAKAYLRRMGIV